MPWTILSQINPMFTSIMSLIGLKTSLRLNSLNINMLNLSGYENTLIRMCYGTEFAYKLSHGLEGAEDK